MTKSADAGGRGSRREAVRLRLYRRGPIWKRSRSVRGAFDAMPRLALRRPAPTTSAALAERLHAEALQRLGFLDAPVSGVRSAPSRARSRSCWAESTPTTSASASCSTAMAEQHALIGPPGHGRYGEDGEPDLHRGPRRGAGGGVELRRAGEARSAGGGGRDLAGAASSWRVADLGLDDPRGALRFSAGSPSTGCARTSRCASRKRERTARRFR